MNYPVYPDAFIPQQPKRFPPQRTFWNRLLGSFLLVLLLSAAYGQNATSPISLTQVSDDGFLLREGWRFQPGDNPNGASPHLNDRQWPGIDPTKDIRQLPQLQQVGIGWLRLHLHAGPDLPPLMIKVFQSVASEMYLDGRLLYRFGTVSANPDSVQAYNPVSAFMLPFQPASDHVLALRVAVQSGQLYNTKIFHWDAAAVQFWLFPATALPALKPVAVQATYLATFKLGVAFILFILHLSLFFSYRTKQANLFAAGMYLLLIVALWASAANDFTHLMAMRILIYYGSFLSIWMPCLAILTFYTLFNFKKGWLCWLSIGSVGLVFIPLPAAYQWLSVPMNYYLPLELIRLSLMAYRRGLPGACIVVGSAFYNLGLWILSYILFALHIPNYGHEWLFHLFYLSGFLCFPLTISLLLALEHGWVNRQLMVRLQEVETLSIRNLAQQQERQQLLAQQNERLEQQVAERTLELHQQADQLRELDGVKSRFVTNITHEFRTPLSLIIAPVEKLLQESRFDRPLLASVHRNAEQLLRLINQLLDLSKLEGKHMAVSLMQGSVPEFIQPIVAQFRRSAEQKGLILSCRLDSLPDPEYRFDADKWEKILTNLLANALKFTEAGGHVTLTATPVWAADELSSVQIQLVDSGIGISPEALPHIFDRFYQTDTSSTRLYGGTGIGLALVHELVGLLGGSLTVESQPEVGTTFRLTLPVQPISTAVKLPQINRAVPVQPIDALVYFPEPTLVRRLPDEELPIPRILIVEDNAELRAFLMSELAAYYDLFQAADGETGWELVQTELPDIVLTDVTMPRLDGYGLTRRIKEHSDTDHIAVVMLTAKAAHQSRIDGLQQGADDYLTKPFSIDELQLRLHNLVSRQQKLGDHYRQQFALPDAVGAPMDSPVDLLTPLPNLNTDPFLLRIYGLLEQHLDDPSIGVDWLADQLAMNRKTLYRKVQSLLQLSPIDLIRQYRLRKAIEFLGSGKNVAETADLAGFNSPSHFALVFKEFYKQTPSEFIASWHKRS